MTLELTDLNTRKETLESDLLKVKEALTKLDTERGNLVAQHHAISGAIQQCDMFIKDLGGVGGDSDSSIPSEKEGS